MRQSRRALTSLLWLSAVLLAGCVADQHLKTSRTFRVMTYNIHHGEGLDGKVDLERIAQLIKTEQVDIVALQEVDKGTARTGRRDFPAELARLCGMQCVFSNNHSFEGGEYGNAVLTRFPVVQSTNNHLRRSGPGEQRGVLQLVLKVHGRELMFMNTHLDHRPDDSERLASVVQLLDLSRNHSANPLPILLCGDFNDVPGSRLYERLSSAFLDSWTQAGEGDGYTIPGQNPKKRIDYIWLSRESGLQAKKLWVPRSIASDHLPVVAELRLMVEARQ